GARVPRRDGLGRRRLPEVRLGDGRDVGVDLLDPALRVAAEEVRPRRVEEGAAREKDAAAGSLRHEPKRSIARNRERSERQTLWREGEKPRAGVAEFREDEIPVGPKERRADAGLLG